MAYGGGLERGQPPRDADVGCGPLTSVFPGSTRKSLPEGEARDQSLTRTGWQRQPPVAGQSRDRSHGAFARGGRQYTTSCRERVQKRYYTPSDSPGFALYAGAGNG